MPSLYLVSPWQPLADAGLVKSTRHWSSGLTMPALEALTPSRRRILFDDRGRRDPGSTWGTVS